MLSRAIMAQTVFHREICVRVYDVTDDLHGLQDVAVPEEEEPVEMLQPADEFTLDKEETAETARRQTNAQLREHSGQTRCALSNFASPFDQRYGGRPDIMNGTIKVHLPL